MYNLIFAKGVRKDLSRLPKKDQKKVLAAFELLRNDPFAGKKLEGDYADKRSLRVWPYRIIYQVHQKIVTVAVLKVAHRQSAYHL